MDDKRYEDWKAELHKALRGSEVLRDFAGEPLDDDGRFEKAEFQVSATDGNGGVIVTVTLTDASRTGAGKQRQVSGNWRKDDAIEVADDAIASYVELREEWP